MYEIRVLDTDSMVVIGKNPNTQTKTCPGLCSEVEKIL
jgi:hypothetical protein